MILDIHTHHKIPTPGAIVNLSPEEYCPPEQACSICIHPWHAMRMTQNEKNLLKTRASEMQTLAIGETGADTMVNVPMYAQILAFRFQAALAEEIRKPLIIHDVKAHAEIISMRRELKARMPWIIHGFRGKPSVAEMLLKEGFLFSFGEKFNPETLRMLPVESIFAETDESTLGIHEIIRRMSDSLDKDLLTAIRDNVIRIFPDSTRY